MNLLQQVATFIWVAFVRPRQPFESWTELRSCLGVSAFLTGDAGRITHSVQVVAWRRHF